MGKRKPQTCADVLTKDVLEKAYQELDSIKAIGREFGFSPCTVARYMKMYGIKYKTKNFKPVVKYSSDFDFFSRDTEASFYWAGFIAADGCIVDTHGSNSVLSISLAEKDTEHLVKFKNDIHSENPVKIYFINKVAPDKKCELKITSQKICDDLKRFNVVPRKTKIYTLPEWLIDHPLKHHFIRGYNDGDGCFCWSKATKNKTVDQLIFNLRGTEKCLLKIREIFETELDLPHRTKPIRKSSGWGTLDYGGNGVLKKIVNYLYQDATIFLVRKKETAFKIYTVNSEVNKRDAIDVAEVAKRYDVLKSSEKVAKEFNVSCNFIINILRRNGYQTIEGTSSKHKRFQDLLTKEKIEDAIKDASTIRGAAKKLEVGATTLKRYMDKLGIHSS